MGKFDDKPDFIYALAFMVFSACLLVTVGAWRSVAFARGGKTEKMSSNDAMKFPITGSCVLGGLFLTFKYLPKEYVTIVLSIYLTVISVITLSSAVRPVLGANPIAGSLCVFVGIYWFYSRSWVLNNVLAYGICVVGVEAVQLAEFKTSVILLVLLFFYDIFWVFGTPVMVTVATSVEGPIKLLFPQSIFGDHKDKSLLGLGDIVIPGFFISQMLRFSLLRWQAQRQKKQQQHGKNNNNKAEKKVTLPERFSLLSWSQCCYFHVVFVSYFLSLITAMFVMVYFESAQPVLLYIVPYTILAVVIFAAFKGESALLWGFAEGAESEEEKKAREAAEKEEAEKKKEQEDRTSFFSATYSFMRETVLFVFGLDEETQKEKRDARLRKIK